jgi:hypothetical protein
MNPNKTKENEDFSSKLRDRISIIVVIILFAVLGWFYWFQYQPTKDKLKCYEQVRPYDRRASDYNYQDSYLQIKFEECLKNEQLSL